MTGNFAGAWRHRRWRWLLASHAVSSVGDFFYYVGLVVFLVERTGSATWVAVAAAVRLLGYALFGSLGGVMADRHDRRRLMILLDMVRAGLMVALAALAWSDGCPSVAIALTLVNSAASTPHRPAVVAATPALVGERDLAAANAASTVASQVAFFLGPALGAVVAGYAGAGTAFLFNGATFAVSGLLLLGIGDVGGGPAAAPRGESPPQPGALGQLRSGARLLTADMGLIALVGFASGVMFITGFDEVVHVLVATDRLHMDAPGVGVLVAAMGVGGLLVAPLTTRLASHSRAGAMLVGSGIMIGLSVMCLAVVSTPAVAVVVLLVAGMGLVAFEVLFITLLQRVAPGGQLGTIFGIQDSITAVAQLSGSLAAPALVALVDLEPSLGIGGALMIATALSLSRPIRRLARRAERARLRLAPTVERLRRLAIFADAPTAALEHIAGSVRSRVYDPGDRVVQEGEPADDLYVITAGTAAVVRAGEGTVAELTVDDWFGEVGVIESAPRNASVDATDRLHVLVIPGDVFHDALALGDGVPDPLRLSIAVRSAGATQVHDVPESTRARPSSGSFGAP